MSAKIDTSDFTAAIKGLTRLMSGSLQKDMVRNLHEAGPQILSEAKAGAHTRIQRRAAATLDVSRMGDGIGLHGGGDVLFAGGEYGGQKSKKVPYSSRSRAGRSYIVRRRTTMQFAPHLGNTGYFFWPTMRDWLPKLEKIQRETLEDAVKGGGK